MNAALQGKSDPSDLSGEAYLAVPPSTSRPIGRGRARAKWAEVRVKVVRRVKTKRMSFVNIIDRWGIYQVDRQMQLLKIIIKRKKKFKLNLNYPRCQKRVKDV